MHLTSFKFAVNDQRSVTVYLTQTEVLPRQSHRLGRPRGQNRPRAVVEARAFHVTCVSGRAVLPFQRVSGRSCTAPLVLRRCSRGSGDR